LSKADLITQADAICRRINARRAATKINNTRDYVRFVPQLAAVETTGAAEMTRLVPPAPLAQDWHTIVRDSQTIAVLTTQLGELAAANDLRESDPVLAKLEPPRRQLVLTAKRDGFTECAVTF
jgi:hypothetical protein